MNSVARNVGLILLAAVLLVFGGMVLSVLIYSDNIANAVLANVTDTTSREMPRTAHAIRSATDNVQQVGGRAEGISCSLPPGTTWLAFRRPASEASVALQARQACMFHDYCYRHGAATYGYTQAECDFLLQEMAFRICRFSHNEKGIDKCKTDARKITLGVRIGGYGSFKSATASRTGDRSSYFEFDPFPESGRRYVVARIGRVAPWLRAAVNESSPEFLPRAAYIFEFQPAGVTVTGYGWLRSGSLVSHTFAAPAPFDALLSAPIPVEDPLHNDELFVWWRRNDHYNSLGRIVAISTSRATEQEWISAISGSAKYAYARSSPSAQSDGLLERIFDGAANGPDLEVSEFHASHPTGPDRVPSLVGLSTGSCGNDEDKDRSSCLVQVQIDVNKRLISAIKYRAHDPNCKSGGVGCDRYRSFSHGPFVMGSAQQSELWWLRRGSASGDSYASDASLRRFAFGKDPRDPATDLGNVSISNAKEILEPFVLIGGETNARLMSLHAESGEVVVYHSKSPEGSRRWEISAAPCKARLDDSWIRRPAHVIEGAHKDQLRVDIVLSRLQPSGNAEELEIATIGMSGDECHVWRSNGENLAIQHSGAEIGPIVVADINQDEVPDVMVFAIDEARGEVRWRPVLIPGSQRLDENLTF